MKKNQAGYFQFSFFHYSQAYSSSKMPENKSEGWKERFKMSFNLRRPVYITDTEKLLFEQYERTLSLVSNFIEAEIAVAKAEERERIKDWLIGSNQITHKESFVSLRDFLSN